MTKLHMEGLSDDEVLEFAEQALGSLHARFRDDEERAEELGDRADEIGEEIKLACDHFDHFAEMVRTCDGCVHTEHPGIRWPASPDGYCDLSYVEKCDECGTYESDEAAAKHLAAHHSVRWGYARRDAHPKTDADFRWEPAPNDGLNYTGWSAFIDRPERDG